MTSESTFLRTFAEFVEGGLLGRVHEMLIQVTLGRDDVIVGHLSHDSMAIEVRKMPHRPQKEGEKKSNPDKKRPGRQLTMALPDMLMDLPTTCRVGTNRTPFGLLRLAKSTLT